MNARTALPSLRRMPGGGSRWRLVGTDIIVFRADWDNRWSVVIAGESPFEGWVARHGLSCARFRTRTEALRALTAAAAVQQPPSSGDEAVKLRRISAGTHRTCDGAYEVRADPEGSHRWLAYAANGIWNAPAETLHQAACLIHAHALREPSQAD